MAAVDTTQGGIGEPASNAVAITAHDTNELANVSRAIYVGGAGNIVAVMLSGQTVTFTGVLAGTILPIRVKQVKSTSTTATALVNLY
jgi:hypothetical protein